MRKGRQRELVFYCVLAVLIGTIIGVVLGPPPDSPTSASYLWRCGHANECLQRHVKSELTSGRSSQFVKPFTGEVVHSSYNPQRGRSDGEAMRP